jgi:hypothetical protein
VARTAVRPPSAAAWSRQLEAASLEVPPALLREARRNTAQARQDPAFLVALGRELALTRGAELTRAYRSLVWVSPGFRRRRGGKRGQRVLGEVCVVFVVRRKRDLAPTSREHLPRWLLAFAERDGARRPFALPTDVQEAADYRGAVAHADSGVWLQRDGWPRANGSFAALVRLHHHGGAATCLLSAQHVLTPFPDGRRLRVVGDLPVLPLDPAGAEAAVPILGVTLPVGGLLRADERPDRPSFDVQLAELSAGGEADVRARTPLRRLHPTRPWARSMAELLDYDRRGWFHLLTPDNHRRKPGRGAVRMTLSTLPAQAFGVPYLMGVGAQARSRVVFHEELLAFAAMDEAVPWPGDSGSPLVVRHADGTSTLVAMHIGGDPARRLSWAIPAWRLFNLDLWGEFPAGARIEPIEP